MENSPKPLENRRLDLTPKNSQGLNWERIYEHGKALDSEKVFCGQVTEPLNPDIAELSANWFARGH